MARRARFNRAQTPGWRQKPPRSDVEAVRRAERRRVNVELATATDPDAIPLTATDKSRRPFSDGAKPNDARELRQRVGRRWKPVHKTPFWKRRAAYRASKREADRVWAEQLEAEVADSEEERFWGVDAAA